jgi:hypothetical protein
MVSFTPLPLYPRGNSRRYALYRRLSGPKFGLDVMEKRKISFLYRESNPDSSVVHLVA